MSPVQKTPPSCGLQPAFPRSGAALLELVVAASFLLAVTQAFLTLSARQSTSLRAAEQRTRATLEVDGRIQYARTLPGSDLEALDGQTFEVDGLPEGAGEAPAGRWEVAHDPERPTVYRVTVSIHYARIPGGDSQRVAFTALVRPGR